MPVIDLPSQITAPTRQPRPVTSRIWSAVAARPLLVVILPWVLTFMVAWVLGFLHNRYIDPDARWTIELSRAKAALLEATPGPRRVILAGGSGTHFGLDAAWMTSHLGIPVVNCGLDAGLGLSPICEAFEDQVRPGDVVILTPEYELLSGEGPWSYLGPVYGLSTGRPGLGGTNLREHVQVTLLAGVPGLANLTSTARSLLKGRYEQPAYAVHNLDSAGDPTMEPPKRAVAAPFRVALHPRMRTYLIDLKSRIESRGATLLLSLPWRLAPPSSTRSKSVAELVAQLEAIAPVLVDREGWNLHVDAAAFTDTGYHLTHDSRQRRSQDLCLRLVPMLEQKP